MRARKFWVALALITLAVWVVAECSREGAPPAPAVSVTVEKLLKVQYGLGKRLCVLANRSIDESSGLACSRRRNEPGLFWTHNDSGDRPRIYAFNSTGKHLGSFRIIGATARDWEDMASYRIGERSYLLLADVGGRKRKRHSIYIVSEPEVSFSGEPADSNIALVASMSFVYEDGRYDCEAVAVDAAAGNIYLFIKTSSSKAKMYVLPLPQRVSADFQKATVVAKIAIPYATAMDISPDGRRAVISTYSCAYEFIRKGDETWKAAFSRKPRLIAVPLRRQGESICYGPDSRTLYLTSEQLPTPLWEVPPRKAVANSDR